MFRNRRRDAVPVATAANTTPSAATAAAQAFLKQQASNASLSNAAAAAALRSHTSSPEPVGSIQTRRMIRRGSNASITSITSAPGLQRRGSQSSMTGRTFRSPSPSARNAAPVIPSIPEQGVPAIPAKSHRRVTSIEPPAHRVASPPPPNAHGRNQSIDSIARSMNYSRPLSPDSPGSNPRAQARARPASSLGFIQIEETQLQREIQAAHQRKVLAKNTPPPAARSAAFQQRAAAAQPPPTGPAALTAANSAASVLAQKTAAPQRTAAAAQLVVAAPAQPHQARSGSRPINPNAVVTNAAMGPSAPRPRAQPVVAAAVAAAAARPASAQANVRPASQVVARPSSAMSNNSNLDAAATARAQAAAMRPSSALSIARPIQRPMSPQQRQNAEILAAAKAKFGIDTRSLPTAATMSDVPSPSAEQIKKFQTRAAAMLARRPSEEPGHPSEERKREEIAKAAAAAPVAAVVAATPVKKGPAPQLSPSSAEKKRQTSPSPTRSAHFADQPVSDTPKHEPMKRGLSPFKSAMKPPQSQTSRSTSPAGSVSKALSDTSDNRSEDGMGSTTSLSKKRKSVRVSFEERPILVGEAAGADVDESALPSPPQHNKLASAAEVDDHTMTPRPVLPSFGSVRTPKRDIDGKESSPTSTVLPGVSAEAVQNVDKVAAATAGTGAAVASIPPRSDSLAPTTSDVPSIAIIPGTPYTEDTAEFVTPVQETEPVTRTSLEEALSAEDAPDVIHSHPKEIVPDGTVPQPHSLGAVIVEEEEEAEHFDDAPEDAGDDLEMPGGYSSLDAIVERPGAEVETPGATPAPTAAKTIATPAVATAPAAAADVVPTDDTDAAPRAEDWTEVAAYWTGLSEQQKRQLEAEAAARELSNGTPAAANGKLANGNAANGGKALLPPWPDKEYQNSVKRDASAAAAPASQAARSKPGPISTAAAGAGTGVADQTPASPTSPTTLAKNAWKKAKPKMTRTTSKDDSDDSESSFKRTRRGRKAGNAADNGRYSMKRSMRGAEAGTMDSGDGRLGAMSPDFGSPPPTQRHVMRASIRDSGPSLRGQPPQKKSLFGRDKGGKKGSDSRGSRYSSRFADSSDEEDGAGRSFFSRFVDSDDENAPTSPTVGRKVKAGRGSTRRFGQQRDYDSDIDSSDEEPVRTLRNSNKKDVAGRNQAPAVTVTSAPPNGAPPGVALSAGTLRNSSAAAIDDTKTSNRRSFLGLSKKQQPELVQPKAVPTDTIPEDRALEEVTTPRLGAGETPTGSPRTSRTSRFGRSLRRLSISSAPESEKHDYAKEGFPFPPPPIPDSFLQENGAERPITSDGISNRGPVRPALNTRDSAMTAPSTGSRGREPIVSLRTGKKKKFQGLRRMFGIVD